MKRLALASVFLSVGAYAACSSPEPATSGGKGGGAPYGGTAGTNSVGGVSGTSMGGVAGTNAGTSGAAGTAVVGGTGGAPLGGTGGAPLGGTGGVPTGGTGGDGVTGGTGGDGVTGGTGGVPTGGTGGAMTGGTGGAMTGGTGGAMTGGTGGSGGTTTTCPTPAQLFPVGAVSSPAGAMGSFDGRLVTTPCADTNSDDCTGGGWIYNGVTTGCNGSLTAQQDFVVGGTAGTQYQVRVHFYGITEPKNYGGNVTREAGTTRPSNGDTGAATPAPWAYTTSAGAKSIPLTDYNTYEIHVLDNNNMVYRQYFINSDLAEGHWTYIIDYERTITVIGGGHIRFRQYDNNCRMIKNCWSGGSNGPASACATKARSVPGVTAAMPAPTNLMQPGLGNDAGNSGQWIYTDVVGVTCP